MIREQDISRALLRASLGTSAQHDPALSKLRVSLPSGPIRPLLSSIPAHGLSTSQSSNTQKSSDPFAFTSQLLGTPLLLSYTVTFPLDLFLDKPALDTYAALFGYLSGIRRIHTRIHDCWESLSNAQRQRRIWTGLSEGGTAEDLDARKQLLRCGWGLVTLLLSWTMMHDYSYDDSVVRDMSWFMDTLLGYVMIDVVTTEYSRFKEMLKKDMGSTESPEKFSHSGISTSTRAPVTSSGHALDFTTLRRLHADYLERLLSGCLLTSAPLTGNLRGIFEICEQFVAQVERWGGDILPGLLSEGTLHDDDTHRVGAMVKERWRIVEDMNNVNIFNTLAETNSVLTARPQTLHAHFDDFCDQLSSSTSTQFGTADASRSMTFTAHLNNMTELNMSKAGKSMDAAGAADARRHVERLLLRFDFNTAHPLRRKASATPQPPP